MNKDDIDKIPEAIATGKITMDQAINKLSIFILKNKALFGLHIKDEDFCSDVILDFLERAGESFKSFNPSFGTFSTYLFCILKSITSTKIKQKANRNIIEYYNISECINNYDSEVEAYENINYKDLERPKIPYNYKKIPHKDFQLACKCDTYRIKKILNDKEYSSIQQKIQKLPPKLINNIILVLALKSSYYLTDNQIDKICYIFNIRRDLLHGVIQELKNTMENREQNKLQLEQRRNKAYFQHKKLKNQLEWIEENDEFEEFDTKSINRKYNKNTKNWNYLNQQLEDGMILIRPTSKIISEILGISIRQVTYYQTKARKLGIDLSKV